MSRECFKKNRVVQQSHIAKKHRKVPLSSGNIKGMERQEDESQGIRDRNQADVGGEVSGGGVTGLTLELLSLNLNFNKFSQ